MVGPDPDPADDGRRPTMIGRMVQSLRRLHASLGVAGLTVGAVSLLALAFGLIVLGREYDRLRRTGREALRPALGGWVRSVPVHYLGFTLADYADSWRRAPSENRATRLEELRERLQALGGTLDHPDQRSPLVEIVALDLRQATGQALASWRSTRPRSPSDLVDRIELLGAGRMEERIDLDIGYRVAPEIEAAAAGLEASYRRVLFALWGLSVYPLLCLIYMALQARALQDRAARESAQAATLDLADRTCHELGNVAFVLSNERKNLADHLDLVDRFVAEEPGALTAAALRAGLDPIAADRFVQALRREYADRGIDPAIELRGGVALARDVSRQVAVCSDYIALTVRELDGYLKQSAMPVQTGPVSVAECLDDALALLGPRLEAASVRVDRQDDGDGRPPVVVADRRLLVHALLNLLKNAVEATAGSGRAPQITLTVRRRGPLVWIGVADNGPGIPSGALGRIFEFGYSTKGAGRGRGLAIVRESVQVQGGRVEVESRPGTGTEFRVGLPAAEAPDAPLASGRSRR